ncbi:hypothetical protein [Lysobacter sp. CA199]|uniref:hypothetical protein n=1 Tax=Lysobacter sp. CA199 TaxID=3455608 RepID=UPI003F8D4679
MDSVTLALALLLSIAFAAHAEPPPDGAVWNADRSAAAVSTDTGKGAAVFAFLRQRDGSYLKVDLSEVESRNLAKLGRGRDHDRVATRPMAWLRREDGLLQLKIQTRAWRKGKRYSAEEPLILQRDGQILWR